MASHRTRSVNGTIPKSLIPASLKPSIGGNSIEMTEGDPSISPSIARRRGHSTKRTALSTVIKRSVSSPSFGAIMDEGDAESKSAADKRRNRLGYHRTSVACGHCRRRKIRCLLAPGDPQGRCSNCIRLRKDCKFYPVDQQPPTGSRPRSGSRADASSNDAETSTSSSPVHQSGSTVVDQVDGYAHLQPHPLTTSHDFSPMIPFSASTASSSGRTPASGFSFEYPQSYNPSPSWDEGAFVSQSPEGAQINTSVGEDISSNYWRANTSPMPGVHPQTHQFPNPAPLIHESPQSANDPPRRDAATWHQPTAPLRSMSVASPQELPAQYHARYFQQSSITTRQIATSPNMQGPPPFRHASMDVAATGHYSATGMTPADRSRFPQQMQGFTFPHWNHPQPQRSQIVVSNMDSTSPDWYPIPPQQPPSQQNPNVPQFYHPSHGHPNIHPGRQ